MHTSVSKTSEVFKNYVNKLQDDSNYAFTNFAKTGIKASKTERPVVKVEHIDRYEI